MQRFSAGVYIFKMYLFFARRDDTERACDAFLVCVCLC